MLFRKGSLKVLAGMGVLLLVLGLLSFVFISQVNAATGCFPDTNGHWAETFICWLKNNGISSGYPDGTYQPDNNVTRAEMSVFVKKVYDLAQSNDDDTLAGLSCSKDEVAKWDGSAWVCSSDESGSGAASSPLDSLSCASGEVVIWDGSDWACKSLGDDFYTETEVDAMMAAKDARIQDLEDKLAAVKTENGGDDFVFEGVNVHIRDGTGDTAGSPNGKGNLIVGYNEDLSSDANRSGSHNIIVGPEHSYSSYGGLVGGYANTISGSHTSVVGGNANTASGTFATVSGGQSNTASGLDSSISGGVSNAASNNFASVSGGEGNIASGRRSSITGGTNNTASGWAATVSGGRNNLASGGYSSALGGGGDSSAEGNEAWALYSVVVAGRSNVAGDKSGSNRSAGEASAVLAGRLNETTYLYASVAGGRSNLASDLYAAVSGGYKNEAGGDYASILGGDRNHATGSWSTVSGGYDNLASGDQSSISGGSGGSASGQYSTIGGGLSRDVTGQSDWRAGSLFETQ